MSLHAKHALLAAAATVAISAGLYGSLAPASLPPPAPTAAPAAAPAPVAAAPSADAARLRQLEQQVEHLTQRLSLENAARANAAPPPEPPTQEEMEQHRQAAREMFAMKVDLYQQERMDSGWAEPARHSLETSMGSILESLPAGNRGRLLGVDCRTRTCMATLEFPNFGAARDQYPRFVQHFYDVPCGRTVILDPAEDPSRPYQVKVLFDECARN